MHAGCDILHDGAVTLSSVYKLTSKILLQSSHWVRHLLCATVLAEDNGWLLKSVGLLRPGIHCTSDGAMVLYDNNSCKQRHACFSLAAYLEASEVYRLAQKGDV